MWAEWWSSRHVPWEGLPVTVQLFCQNWNLSVNKRKHSNCQLAMCCTYFLVQNAQPEWQTTALRGECGVISVQDCDVRVPMRNVFFPGLLDFTDSNLGQIIIKWTHCCCFTIQHLPYCLEANRKAGEMSDGYLLQHFAGLGSFCSLCVCLWMFLVFFFLFRVRCALFMGTDCKSLWSVRLRKVGQAILVSTAVRRIP